MHKAHTFQPHDIGDFVGVGEHGCRAVGHHCAGELGGGQHAAFNVHVAIAKAGQDEATVCLYHYGVRPDHGAGVRPAIGETAISNGDVGVRDHLAGVDVNPLPLANNHISRGAARGDVD